MNKRTAVLELLSMKGWSVDRYNVYKGVSHVIVTPEGDMICASARPMLTEHQSDLVDACQYSKATTLLDEQSRQRVEDES